jgi:hypothetical protein
VPRVDVDADKRLATAGFDPNRNILIFTANIASAITDMAPFHPYPTANTELIEKLDLVEHFEGGFFKQTEVLEAGMPVR